MGRRKALRCRCPHPQALQALERRRGAVRDRGCPYIAREADAKFSTIQLLSIITALAAILGVVGFGAYKMKGGKKEN